MYLQHRDSPVALCVEAGVHLNCKTQGKKLNKTRCNAIALNTVTPSRRLLEPRTNCVESPCRSKGVEVLEVVGERCVKERMCSEGEKLKCILQ